MLPEDLKKVVNSKNSLNALEADFNDANGIGKSLSWLQEGTIQDLTLMMLDVLHII